MSKPLSELPEFVSGFVADLRDVLFETAARIRDRMAEPGKPRAAGEKVDWDSPVQQRGFFASGGFGQGIPYRPTHLYELSWRAERTDFGASLKNPHKAAGAIGGLPSGWQSRIHRGRRPYLLQVLTDELQKMPDDIRNKFSARSGKE